MNVRVALLGLCIAVDLCGRNKSVSLRRFPWPASECGRRQKSHAATVYAQSVANVMECACDIDPALAIGVEVARLGLSQPNYQDRRLAERRAALDVATQQVP